MATSARFGAPTKLRRALGLLGGLAAAGCLNAAEERAQRDREVGHAHDATLSVDVGEGHAAIRALDAERVWLWGSVPAFQVTLEPRAAVPMSFDLVVHNLMPDATVTADADASVRVGPPQWSSRTRASWRVELLRAEPVTLTVAPPDAADPGPFRFALLSDVQEAIDAFSDMVVRVNQEQGVRFVLGAGDLTSGGTRQELERFQYELEAMDVPYYATLGNHELGEDPAPYQDYFGRGNYSFEFRGVRFTLLDSASATLDPLVYDWLDGWLEQGSGQVHVVAMHIPPMDPSGTRHGGFASKNEAAKLLNQLALYHVDLTLYGHIHTYIHFENAGIDAHIAGGGGAIPNRGDGIGRHYLVVDVSRRGHLAKHVVEVDSDWASY